jgi:hypothetical protein
MPDRLAWHAALRPGDVFDPGGTAAAWSAPTQRKTALGYGRFLFWLQQRGELGSDAGAATRVTRERVAAYLGDLRRINRGHTIHNRIQELGDAMRALAPDSARLRSPPATRGAVCDRSMISSLKAFA